MGNKNFKMPTSCLLSMIAASQTVPLA